MKKAVFITYNQALTERVAFLLDQLQIKGFTQWPLVNGAGTETGEPRMGSHTWPEMNSATITIVEEEMVPLIALISSCHSDRPTRSSGKLTQVQAQGRRSRMPAGIAS